MATRAQTQALARKLGCDLKEPRQPYRDRWRDEPQDGCLEVWAPAGSVFAASSCHVICCPWPFGMPAPAAWAGLLEQMREGLESCDQPDCEICDDPCPDCGAAGGDGGACPYS